MYSIYKYTSYRPEFFDNFLLKISRFGEFNDPFEMVMGNYLSSLSKEEADEIMSLSYSLSDAASYYNYYYDVRAGARASIGVICFSSNYDNILMWSHYANNHKGICIEFDLNDSFFHGKYKDVPSELDLFIDNGKSAKDI